MSKGLGEKSDGETEAPFDFLKERSAPLSLITPAGSPPCALSFSYESKRSEFTR